MKTWHIVLIFVAVAILGMFIYLQNQKRKKEEETKQLALLYGAQSGLLNQANQSGFIGGLFSGVNSTISSASGALAQNPGLLSFL
jgi:hypothetical protein